jgi:hypothetical protein
LKQKPGPTVLWFWCFSMKNRRFFYSSKNWNWWLSDAQFFKEPEPAVLCFWHY